METLRASDTRRVWSAAARVQGGIAQHDHDYFEIAVVTGGRSRHRTLYGESVLRPRHVMLIPPGTWHAYAEADRLRVRNWGFRAEVLRRELAWLMDEPCFAALLWQRPTGDGAPPVTLGRFSPSAHQRAVALSDRVALLRPAQNVAAVAALLELLELCSQAMDAPRDQRDTSPPHRAVVAATALLLERYAEDWTLPALARAVHVEPSYLTRLFSLHIGRPPMAYLGRLRLERAAALLLSGDQPVGEIGRSVGLDDPTYFARRFRQHFGVSPSRFREEHR
ncbi:MAG: AraC family transcriptional regulator [Planctomycetota bacterium]